MLFRSATTAWREAAPEQRGYLDYATLYASAGRVDRARALVAEYRSRIDTKTRAGSAADLHGALGAIAVAEGRPEDAIREYRAIRDSLPECTICALEALGRAYETAGQLDSAVALYERYLSTPWLFRANQDNVHLVSVLRRVAALHERLGDREQAIAHLDRIVELWERADPELQHIVEEAQATIARLLGEG